MRGGVLRAHLPAALPPRPQRSGLLRSRWHLCQWPVRQLRPWLLWVLLPSQPLLRALPVLPISPVWLHAMPVGPELRPVVPPFRPGAGVLGPGHVQLRDPGQWAVLLQRRLRGVGVRADMPWALGSPVQPAWHLQGDPRHRAVRVRAGVRGPGLCDGLCRGCEPAVLRARALQQRSLRGWQLHLVCCVRSARKHTGTPHRRTPTQTPWRRCGWFAMVGIIAALGPAEEPL